jgi:hypothetical protein
LAVDFSGLNEACLSAFGQAFMFTRNVTGDSQSVIGILEAGIELEEVPPGDGSIYAKLWIQSADIVPAPEAGDEFSTATTVYKIVRMEKDAGGGLLMLLRQDRMI